MSLHPAITRAMVEAAAKAIVARHSNNWDDGITEQGRELWRGDARAALEAAIAEMGKEWSDVSNNSQPLAPNIP